jgi:hypothetical protein
VKAQEHRALGDEASGGAKLDLALEPAGDPLVVGFGDVVALSGDYFYPTAEPGLGAWAAPGPEVLASGGLFALAALPGADGTAVGTRDEVICTLKVMAADQGLGDPRFEADGEFAHYRFSATAAETDVEQRVRDRFLALGASNDDHFVAPGRRGSATEGDRAVARFGSAPAAYRRLHQLALEEAFRLGRLGGELTAAMALEAAAQHYLTDAFAAGHLRTPVAAIREFWQIRYPWFWEQLQRKVAADTSAALRELARPLRLLPSRSLYRRTVSAVRSAGYPRVSFGDLLAKVFHDWDNGHGLTLEDGEVVFGDGCLDQGVTRDRALSACRAGIDDIEVAHRLGAGGRHLSGESLYAAVREATRAEGEVFVAESRVPRPSDDNPRQNWEAADVETLWEAPIVGSTGPRVGEAVAHALEAGEELPSRLDCLGHGITAALDVPPVPGLREWLSRKACQAYHQGFMANLMSDPRACVLDVVGSAGRDGAPRRAA